MKLTEEMKQKIYSWFESKTEGEVKNILNGYGIEPNQKESIEERPVGDVFEFEGHKLKVVKSKNFSCFGCYFSTKLGSKCWDESITDIGACDNKNRSDKNYVIFVEV